MFSAPINLTEMRYFSYLGWSLEMSIPRDSFYKEESVF